MYREKNLKKYPLDRPGRMKKKLKNNYFVYENEDQSKDKNFFSEDISTTQTSSFSDSSDDPELLTISEKSNHDRNNIVHFSSHDEFYNDSNNIKVRTYMFLIP